MYVTAISAAVAFVLGSALSGWLTYEVVSGRHAKELHGMAIAYVDYANAALAKAGRDAETQLTEAVRVAEERSRLSDLAEEVIDEIHQDDSNLSCDWTVDQRLHFLRLYQIYGFAEGSGVAGGLSAGMQPSPVADGKE